MKLIPSRIENEKLNKKRILDFCNQYLQKEEIENKTELKKRKLKTDNENGN